MLSLSGVVRGKTGMRYC